MFLHRCLCRVTFTIIAALSVVVASQEMALAQGKKATGARCVAVHGALFLQSSKSAWTNVPADSDVPIDQRVVALFGADFRSLNDAVEARLVADVGQRGPFPVLEAAAQFHAGKAVDLEATLERGVLVLTNQKKAGSAQIRLRVSGQEFEVTLSDPTSRLDIEVYGRHVPGTADLSDPKKDQPVINVVFFAVAGEALIANGIQATRLLAPPGTAMYLWDNVTRQPEVRRFEKLPDFAMPMDEKERKQFAAICACAKHLGEKPSEVGKTLAQAIRSQEARERKVAVVAMGALNELPRLLQVFEQKDHADARDMAILVLRHWLGREPGQSIKLYQHLTKDLAYTPVQAKGLLYLCNGMEDAKKKQPSTYDVLIQALNHSKAPLRELARWHLVRLVPDGKAIAYDAAGAEPQRLQAITEWRRLVPEGELPLPSKKPSSRP